MKSNKLKEVSNMKSNKDAFKTLLFFLIILIFASQNSCSTTGSMTTVPPENRIPVIVDEPQQGKWESKNIALKYEFVKEDDTIGLFIDGSTKRRLDQVVLWVSFLDEDGRVLERETVFNSGFRNKRTSARRMEGTIERAFEVPPGTRYLAFRSQENPYRGRL